MKIFVIGTTDMSAGYFGNYKTKKDSMEEWAQEDQYLQSMIFNKEVIFLTEDELLELTKNISLSMQNSLYH